uniref:Uncharacterized protein n=1 Tax=Ixodes ricinus TaxID=34613 RepID=A0A6B0UCW9_IXORI
MCSSFHNSMLRSCRVSIVHLVYISILSVFCEAYSLCVRHGIVATSTHNTLLYWAILVQKDARTHFCRANCKKFQSFYTVTTPSNICSYNRA